MSLTHGLTIPMDSWQHVVITRAPVTHTVTVYLNSIGGSTAVWNEAFLPDAVGTSYTGGLAVWHIQDNLSSSCSVYNNCVAQSPKMIDLEEANNGDLDNASSNGRTIHLFYNGNSATFDNDSTPNSRLNDGTSSGISLTSISAAGDNMTLTISK